MLTFFTIPKPFVGQTAIQQINAIESWLQVTDHPEIFLCGNDQGVAKIAKQYGLHHLPNISLSEYGTPLVSDAFALVSASAVNRLICYVNADIILLPDFVKAVKRIPFSNFMMVGQRYDLDLKTAIDFNNPNYASDLLMLVSEQGKLHPPTGSDYFVFPKDSGLLPLPPFAVGRPAWDNWMIYHAFDEGLPVIDASRATTVIHQNHSYAHVPQRTGTAWEGPEADANRRLFEKGAELHTLREATFILTRSFCYPSPKRTLARLCSRAIRRLLKKKRSL